MMFPEIEAERKKLGLTARSLCALAGVDPAAYSQFRNGKRDPRQSTLQRLAQALDLCGSGDAVPNGEGA